MELIAFISDGRDLYHRCSIFMANLQINVELFLIFYGFFIGLSNPSNRSHFWNLSCSFCFRDTLLDVEELSMDDLENFLSTNCFDLWKLLSGNCRVHSNLWRIFFSISRIKVQRQVIPHYYCRKASWICHDRAVLACWEGFGGDGQVH